MQILGQIKLDVRFLFFVKKKFKFSKIFCLIFYSKIRIRIYPLISLWSKYHLNIHAHFITYCLLK